MTPDELDARIAASWSAQEADRLDLLARLVAQNSHSDNIGGIDRERALLRPAFEEIGFSVDEPEPDVRSAPRPRAAHLVARRPVEGRPRVVLIGHLDTVFPPGDGRTILEREGEILHGPGVGDIKGGVVAILAALTALREAGLEDRLSITVFLNSDEEVGSHTSRELLRSECRGADWALGFEPAFHPAGESVGCHSRIQHVVKRKGCGRWSFRLQGVAAHSGGAHQAGASAIEALAIKVREVHALTAYESGVTTNVGLVAGGRSVNTVAPNASGEIDFRFSTNAEGDQASAAMRRILERRERPNPENELEVGCELEPGGGVLWPTLEPTDDSLALSQRVLGVTRRLGWEAEAIARGGASDAANAAAVGVPVICGLGPVTHGIHTDEEHSSLTALSRSARIAAALLADLAG
jgi:glutamate carboxypeptidase